MAYDALMIYFDLNMKLLFDQFRVQKNLTILSAPKHNTANRVSTYNRIRET